MCNTPVRCVKTCDVRGVYLDGEHALLLTDGSNHLVHFVRHFLEEPVRVLYARRANGVTLQHASTSMSLKHVATCTHTAIQMHTNRNVRVRM